MGLKFYKIEGEIIKHYWTTLLTLRTCQISLKALHDNFDRCLLRKIVFNYIQQPFLLENFSKLRIEGNLDKYHTFKSGELQAFPWISGKRYECLYIDSKALCLSFIIFLFSTWIRKQIK